MFSLWNGKGAVPVAEDPWWSLTCTLEHASGTLTKAFCSASLLYGVPSSCPHGTLRVTGDLGAQRWHVFTVRDRLMSSTQEKRKLKGSKRYLIHTQYPFCVLLVRLAVFLHIGVISVPHVMGSLANYNILCV